MKKDLDHLPPRKQRELSAIVQEIFTAFEEATAKINPRGGKTSGGKIIKIILFGSHARGDWVDEPHTTKGYRSDFDILILVDKDYLVNEPGLFRAAEDLFLREHFFKTPVQFIVHTWGDVNSRIANGEYFFLDIAKEGIALYECDTRRFSNPRHLTGQEAYEQAKGYYERWMAAVDSATKLHRHAMSENLINDAAFLLHQVTERLYDCVLLVLTSYAPATHNLSALRSFTESRDERLRDIWLEETRFQKRAFERLKRAYVDARYSEHFEITEEELKWLGERVDALRQVVKVVCKERLDALQIAQ